MEKLTIVYEDMTLTYEPGAHLGGGVYDPDFFLIECKDGATYRLSDKEVGRLLALAGLTGRSL